jgi:hypothetical protein
MLQPCVICVSDDEIERMKRTGSHSMPKAAYCSTALL